MTNILRAQVKDRGTDQPSPSIAEWPGTLEEKERTWSGVSQNSKPAAPETVRVRDGVHRVRAGRFGKGRWPEVMVHTKVCVHHDHVHPVGVREMQGQALNTTVRSGLKRQKQNKERATHRSLVVRKMDSRARCSRPEPWLSTST